jgi:D-3-phosphoglycerate dehydrogenase
MHVLIADAVSDSAVAQLEDAGHRVTKSPGLKADALTDALRQHQPDVLVVRSTKVTGADLDASPNLELVVRAGAGTDTIDVEGASRRGVFVSNCPGKNAAAVAELAFGLILALDRRIPDNVIEARAGRWRKGAFSKAEGVKGRTLGLIGMGSIGQEMVQRARAFEMPVVAWSRSLTPEKAKALGVRYAPSPLHVAQAADAVSLHVAATEETIGLADREFLEAMKPGAILINTARDKVLDEAALAEIIDRKGLRVATDVPAGEPSAREADDFEHPLAGHENVYITHHIGASTEQASAAIADEAARVILAYAETGRVPNCINMAAKTPATHLLTVRHLDRVGVLAGVLDAAREAGWNVQEMENLIFDGAEAAVARIRFDGEPTDAALERVRGTEHVIAASVLPVA